MAKWLFDTVIGELKASAQDQLKAEWKHYRNRWGKDLLLAGKTAVKTYLTEMNSPTSPSLMGTEENPGPRNKLTIQKKKLKKEAKSQGKPKRNAVVGLSPQANSGGRKTVLFAGVDESPARYMKLSGPRSRKNKDGVTVRGRQVVAQISTSGTAGLVVFTAFNSSTTGSYYVQMNPTLMGLPLSRISTGYLRFKFHKLKITYTPAVGSSTDGEIILGYDADGSYTNITSSANASAISGSPSSMIIAPWNSGSVTCDPDLTDDDWFYCYPSGSGAADRRLANQGEIVMTGQTSKSTDNFLIGTVYVEYECEFMNSAIETTLQFAERLESQAASIRKYLELAPRSQYQDCKVPSISVRNDIHSDQESVRSGSDLLAPPSSYVRVDSRTPPPTSVAPQGVGTYFSR